MPKSISWRKLVRKLNKLGFYGPFSGGRHLFMERNGHKIYIPNPHRSDLSVGLVAMIIRQAKISLEDWNKI
ncbi:MAG: type II toxin-antitoxin system HicA family toxin [Patescibacteria group bacterium]